MSWSDALASAGRNLLPSAASNISNTLHALAPWNLGETIGGLNQLGVGLESKLGLIDKGNPAEQAKDEAALNAVGKMYADRYGSVEGFKRTLANDPFAIGSDLATVATLPLGGEGLISKVPDAAEAVLLAGAGAARQGGTLSNALLNSAVHVPAAMRAAGNIARPILKTGQWADPAYAASQIAGGGVNAARALGRVPVVGRAVRGAIGAGIGHTVGGMLPFVGHTGGTIIGEHIAEGLVPKTGPHAPGLISRGVGAGASALPIASTVGGTEPMSPAEQAQQPGAAPPAAPGAPPPAAGQGGGGGGSGDMLADALADSGLVAHDAEASPPPSGPQGPPPAGHLAAPRGAMFGHIADIAGRAGANAGEISTLQQIARVESGGNPNATSPSGRYHGLFQYADSRGDPEADTMRALGDLRRNEDKLKGLGVTPDAGALYVMHQQGAGGGPALLTAPPGTKAIDAIARFYGSRAVARQAIAHNIGINYRTPEGEAQANAAAENMTAAEFVNLWRNKLSGVPFADGGRVGFQAGGQVVDLTERLLKRAGQAQKAAQAATKPLLGLSDDTVAAALRVAQRGL